ncbi:MAG: plasmid recombination protein [Butyrivibrio sp.]|nr:plasmid recombination protein [Butyrivibrio sp.]
MRASRHNGRAGRHGTYNPKHNDREFDVNNAEDINSEMTPYNIYWNCVDRKVVQHKDRDENWHSFTEVEKGVYELLYKDYLNGQNERHIASRHKERVRTMDDIRENKKTCPEETIYQIGNINGTVDYDVLMDIAGEFFKTISERYGEHVHVLNWALHLDEGTPHIHERHVFDVINKYGERQPKQEEALKQLGFELPEPDKKPSKYNNRKISYDAKCRELFLEICKKHGLEIEDEPIYGGKKYLEKKEFIIEKLNANLKDLQERFYTVDELYSEALKENERLTAINENLEMKIEDVEGLLKEVSDIAYDKACETLIDEITDKTRAEDLSSIESYKKWLMSSDRKAPKEFRDYAISQLNQLQDVIKRTKDKVVSAVKNIFSIPEKKSKFTEEIVEKARPSTLELLRKHKSKIAEEDKKRSNIIKKNRGDISL